MRIFGMGTFELLIILAIVVILFGPALFVKINKRVKKTGKAAKTAVENGSKAAGTEVDLDSIDKSKILDKVESFQDRVDKMFADAEEDDEESSDASASDDSDPDASQQDASSEKASK